jgi:hypothetical protein
MIAPEAFATGLHALAVAHGLELKPERVEVYYEMLGHLFTAESWSATVRASLLQSRYFPSIAELLAAAPERKVDETKVRAAYDAIVRIFEQGLGIDSRALRESYGEPAAQAFAAAGGVQAFSWCEPSSEPFRWKAWREAWLRAEKDAVAALPVAGEQRMLR